MLPALPIAARLGAKFLLPLAVGAVGGAISVTLAVLRNRSEHEAEPAKAEETKKS